MKNIQNQKRLFIGLLITALIFIASFMLFRNQILCPGGRYPSDLPAHIRSALKGNGYSLVASIFRTSWAIVAHNNSLAVALALVVALTIPASMFLLKRMLILSNSWREGDYWLCFWIAAISIYICAIYIPHLQPLIYKKSFVTQPWHNSTYLLMRLFGVMAFAYYLKIEENYLEKIQLKDAVIFTVLLTLVNYSKPNFIVEFAPMMLIYLICDFIRLRGKKTLQMIKFGICVLLSLWILIIQAKILYPSGGNSGVIFSANKFIEFFTNPLFIVQILACITFPILIYAISIWKKADHNMLDKAWVMFAIGWLESKLLEETGRRANHGNFTWGVKLASFILYLVSMVQAISLYRSGKIDKRTFMLLMAFYGIFCLYGMAYFGIIFLGYHYYR